jgi:hypothetical protein
VTLAVLVIAKKLNETKLQAARDVVGRGEGAHEGDGDEGATSGGRGVGTAEAACDGDQAAQAGGRRCFGIRETTSTIYVSIL